MMSYVSPFLCLYHMFRCFSLRTSLFSRFSAAKDSDRGVWNIALFETCPLLVLLLSSSFGDGVQVNGHGLEVVVISSQVFLGVVMFWNTGLMNISRRSFSRPRLYP